MVDIDFWGDNTPQNKQSDVYKITGRYLFISVITRNASRYSLEGNQISGVSIGDFNVNYYAPLTHDISYKNVKSERLKYVECLKNILESEDKVIVGYNLVETLGWLSSLGVYPKASHYFDIACAEALLADEPVGSFHEIFNKYSPFPIESLPLVQWIRRRFGGSPIENNLYKCKPEDIGGYTFTCQTFMNDVMRLQSKELKRQNLMDIFNLEMGLIPLLLRMRQEGVRVDIDRAKSIKNELCQRQHNITKELSRTYGFSTQDVNKSSVLAEVFDFYKIEYPVSSNGKPSFTKEFLASNPHNLPQSISAFRVLEKLKKVYIDSYILDNEVNGRIHGTFLPFKMGDKGTISGRFSAMHPNLQNIPSADKEGGMLRSLFIPDEEHKQWRRFDYSQIEFRCLAHFSVGEGADDIRKAYIEDPNIDYHTKTTEMLSPLMGWSGDLSTYRKKVKGVNFGLVYGMGKRKLSSFLGMEQNDIQEFFSSYHTKFPFIQETLLMFSKQAMKEGYVSTHLGRRSRFNLFQRGQYSKSTPLPYQQALSEYGDGLSRAYTYKALNRVLQGTAADILKVALLKAWNSGVFDRIGVPRIMVHDELDFSDAGNVDDGFAEMKNILETSYKLNVPLVADESIGANWSET